MRILAALACALLVLCASRAQCADLSENPIVVASFPALPVNITLQFLSTPEPLQSLIPVAASTSSNVACSEGAVSPVPSLTFLSVHTSTSDNTTQAVLQVSELVPFRVCADGNLLNQADGDPLNISFVVAPPVVPLEAVTMTFEDTTLILAMKWTAPEPRATHYTVGALMRPVGSKKEEDWTSFSFSSLLEGLQFGSDQSLVNIQLASGYPENMEFTNLTISGSQGEGAMFQESASVVYKIPYVNTFVPIPDTPSCQFFMPTPTTCEVTASSSDGPSVSSLVLLFGSTDGNSGNMTSANASAVFNLSLPDIHASYQVSVIATNPRGEFNSSCGHFFPAVPPPPDVVLSVESKEVTVSSPLTTFAHEVAVVDSISQDSLGVLSSSKPSLTVPLSTASSFMLTVTNERGTTGTPVEIPAALVSAPSLALKALEHRSQMMVSAKSPSLPSISTSLSFQIDLISSSLPSSTPALSFVGLTVLDDEDVSDLPPSPLPQYSPVSAALFFGLSSGSHTPLQDLTLLDNSTILSVSASAVVPGLPTLTLLWLNPARNLWEVPCNTTLSEGHFPYVATRVCHAGTYMLFRQKDDPSPPTPSPGGDGGLSDTEIAVIVVVVILGLLALWALYKLWKRRRDRRRTGDGVYFQGLQMEFDDDDDDRL